MKRWQGKTRTDEINETNTDWATAKNQLISLSLNNDGQIIELPDNMEYVQGKTASASLNGGESQVHSRYIGCVLGNNIVVVRINEMTNNIKIEILPHVASREKPVN